MTRVRGTRTIHLRHVVALLLLMLLAAVSSWTAACSGETKDEDQAATAAIAAEVAAQIEALDAVGRRLERTSSRADALQAAIVRVAKANRAAAAAWKEEWAERRSAYEAEVAEVEEYNASVAHPAESGSFTVVDPATGETTTVEFQTAEAVPEKALPAPPEPPAKLKVRMAGRLDKLRGLTESADAIEAELASVPLRPELAGAAGALTAAIAEVQRVLTRTRASVREGVERDARMGQVCEKALTRLDLSAAAAIEAARAALAGAAAENGFAAGLPWASATPTD